MYSQSEGILPGSQESQYSDVSTPVAGTISDPGLTSEKPTARLMWPLATGVSDLAIITALFCRIAGTILYNLPLHPFEFAPNDITKLHLRPIFAMFKSIVQTRDTLTTGRTH